MLTTVSTVLTKESPLPFSTSLRNRAGRPRFQRGPSLANRRSHSMDSIGSGERNPPPGRPPAGEAGALHISVGVEVARVHASGFLGDARLALLALAPGSPDDAIPLFEVRDQLGQGAHLDRVLLTEVQCPLVEVALEPFQLDRQLLGQRSRRHRPPLTRQAVDERDLLRLHVPRAHVQPERHALQLPEVELLTWSIQAPVDSQPDAPGLDGTLPCLNECLDDLPALSVPEDRHHRHLDRRDARRQDEPGVVAMSHYQPAYQARRDPPRRGIAE